MASNIGYLPYGPAEHLEYGPVGTLLTEDRDFDWHYRRTHQTVIDNLSATRLDLDLGYDPAGNLTGITDSVGQRTANYGYDDLGRLTSADWSSGAQTRAYDYDDIGNLERIGVNESLTGDGEVLFGYDPNPSSDNSPVLSSIDTYEGVTLTSTHTVVTDSAGNISDDGQADYDYTLQKPPRVQDPGGRDLDLHVFCRWPTGRDDSRCNLDGRDPRARRPAVEPGAQRRDPRLCLARRYPRRLLRRYGRPSRCGYSPATSASR